MTTEKPKKKPTLVPVKELIATHEARLGLRTIELAERLGYDKGNFVSMLKSGATRPPPDKVPLICEVLGIDLTYFVRCMDAEFNTNLTALIEAGTKRTPITANEEKLILRFRDLSGGMDVDPDDYHQEQAEMMTIFKEMATKAKTTHDLDVARLSRKSRSAVGKADREGLVTPLDALKQSLNDEERKET